MKNMILRGGHFYIQIFCKLKEDGISLRILATIILTYVLLKAISGVRITNFCKSILYKSLTRKWIQISKNYYTKIGKPCFSLRIISEKYKSYVLPYKLDSHSNTISRYF